MTATERSTADNTLQEILRGLGQSPRILPAKLFYDEDGSALFDAITRLDAYYPTRCEIRIMEQHGEAVARLVGPDALLVEFGSGSSLKTRYLLDSLRAIDHTPCAYVPVDISAEHLERSAEALRRLHPDVPVLPLAADYTQPLHLPEPPRPPRRTVAYYPGSTIGNFHPPEAADFLARIRSLVGPDGALLIGVDLHKDTDVIEHAYNDPDGTTAAFNLNMLHRLNREFATDFDLDQWRHLAFFDDEHQRIEMHLESLIDQRVSLGQHAFDFRAGETIRTECSYKYTLERFQKLALQAGFHVQDVFTDASGWFSVQYLTTNA
ncbi:MAG: L-histidine N(alpha)-methyltransferase [Deltaproteobacteria bacterium]|nr:MAG: L-histidine N(alpha)-methyltransferase [Deltaproteobacteria bacterium]